MTVSPTLNTHMKTLRLSGMLDSLDVRLEQARSANLGYMEFLGLIIQDEVGIHPLGEEVWYAASVEVGRVGHTVGREKARCNTRATFPATWALTRA